MSNDNFTHDPNATGAVPGFGYQPSQQGQGWPQQQAPQQQPQQQWPGAQPAQQPQWGDPQQAQQQQWGVPPQGYAPAAPKQPFPLTIREIALGGVGLLVLILSFIPAGDVGTIWSFGILWMLLVVPVVAASALVVVRAFTPAVKRIGSLSVDQFASTVYSWTLAIYLIVGISVMIIVGQILAGFGSFIGGGSSGFSLPWTIWVTIVLLVAGVALTVGAPFIPGLREEFDQRADENAPRAARTTRVLPVKQPRVAAYGAPAPQQWGQQQPAPQAPYAQQQQQPADAGAQFAAFGAPAQPWPGQQAPVQQWPAAAEQAPAQQWATPAEQAPQQWEAPAQDAPAQQWEAPAQEQAPQQWDAPAQEQAADVAHDAPAIAFDTPAEEQVVEEASENIEIAPVESAVEAEPVAEPQVFEIDPEPVTTAPEPEPVVEQAAEPVVEQDAAAPVSQQPFWALVPVDREVVDSNGAPLFTITPAAWALVVEDRGDVFVVRDDDGRIGFLMDVSGVTRG